MYSHKIATDYSHLLYKSLSIECLFCLYRLCNTLQNTDFILQLTKLTFVDALKLTTITKQTKITIIKEQRENIVYTVVMESILTCY